MPVPDPVIVQGDARALQLPDECVDLIVTSPPYFGLRDYGTDGQIGAEATPQEFIAALVECTREMVRVLKPSGSIFVNLGDKYSQRPGQYPMGNAGAGEGLGGGARNADHIEARRSRPYTGMQPKSLMLLPERYRIAAVDELGLIARAVLVWSKPNGLPESVTDRVRRSHEDWVHLTKQPRYFAAVDQIREQYSPNKPWGARGAHRYPAESGRRDTGALAKQEAWTAKDENPLGKLPGSVWEIATQPLKVPAELGIDHFAAFPMEWPRRLVLGWSPVGGTVLDPFGGTGTTAIVAHALGRVGISVDLSADYVRLAQWRATDPKQRERASRPAGSKPVAPKQQAPSTATSEPLVLDLPA